MGCAVLDSKCKGSVAIRKGAGKEEGEQGRGSSKEHQCRKTETRAAPAGCHNCCLLLRVPARFRQLCSCSPG